MTRTILFLTLILLPVNSIAENNTPSAQVESNEIISSTLGFGSSASSQGQESTLLAIIDKIKKELFD